MTAAEIAQRYHRAVTTIRANWMSWPEWPDPVGKRGRWLEFDAAAVEDVVRPRLARKTPTGGNPGDLLTPIDIAEYTGLARGTVRADISRGRFGEPDDIDAGGVQRWRRSSVDKVMVARRNYRKSNLP